MAIWIKFTGRPTEISFKEGNVNTLKREIKVILSNKLEKIDIDEITLQAHGKEEILREDEIIDKNFITSYDEPVIVKLIPRRKYSVDLSHND
jgi:hypothetical protein